MTIKFEESGPHTLLITIVHPWCDDILYKRGVTIKFGEEKKFKIVKKWNLPLSGQVGGKKVQNRKKWNFPLKNTIWREKSSKLQKKLKFGLKRPIWQEKSSKSEKNEFSLKTANLARKNSKSQKVNFPLKQPIWQEKSWIYYGHRLMYTHTDIHIGMNMAFSFI